MNALGSTALGHEQLDASWDELDQEPGALSRFADRCPSAMTCTTVFCLLVLGFLTATMYYAQATLPPLPAPPATNPSAWSE